MVRPSPAVVSALEGLVPDDELALVLGARRPDLTDVLLRVAAEHEDLPRVLVQAVCRAACARLKAEHGGHSIELRVPPYAAVQLGFGSGPRHTRGTPPNVVEMEPSTFVALITGRLPWADADVRASGAHAGEVAMVFPLA